MFCTGYCDNDNENVVIRHNNVNLKDYNKNIQLNMLILKINFIAKHNLAFNNSEKRRHSKYIALHHTLA